VALNRAIKLMITPCGHTICQPCFGSGFKGTRTMACKACGKDENGNTFDFAKEEVIPTDGEDEMVKRELRIRSRVLGIFNRQEAGLFHLSVFLSICLSFYLSILFFSPLFHLSIYLSIYLSIFASFSSSPLLLSVILSLFSLSISFSLSPSLTHAHAHT